MKKTGISIFALALTILPGLASAQSIGGIFGLLDQANQLINKLIPFIITLALLVFLWGILKYVFSTDEEARGQAKNYMIYGIIGLFVMVSVWGLVNILVRSLSLDNNAPNAPALPNSGGTFIQR